MITVTKYMYEYNKFYMIYWNEYSIMDILTWYSI